MATSDHSADALAGIRVLDLSNRYGHYAGKLFADMGADVILVEPPGGCAMRGTGPFLEDRVDPALGIPFNYFNCNKRGVVLDLDADRAVFEALASTADLVIEDAEPGAMRARGLDYARLAALKPSLVVASITPFGQTGPYAHFAANDLTLLAMGGFLNMMGYPDTAPTRVHGDQAIAIGCMFAAVGAMIALLAAQADGQGQHVDVAIQECVAMAIENAAQTYDLAGTVRKRFAGTQRHAGTGVFPCADGYIYLFAGGMAARRFWPNLVDWLRDERVPGWETLAGERWRDNRFMDSEEAKAIFDEVFPPFCALRSKEQMYHEGQSRRVPLCPIASVDDVAANAQMRHRGLFVQVPHPRLDAPILMPGVPFRMSVSPGGVRRAAPALGEHDAAILGPLRTQRAAYGSTA